MTILLAGVAGLAAGGLLNILITLLSREEGFWSGPLCTPGCRQSLPWSSLVFFPAFGWHRGRCRHCGKPLPWQYPAVEAAAALLAATLWRYFGGSGFFWTYAVFAAMLLVLTVLDLNYFWLPDVITLPGIGLGLASALILPQPGVASALLGAVAGWAFFRGVAWAYARLTPGRRQGLGQGDAKFMACIGAVLGLKALPWVLFSSAALGSLAGLIVARQRGRGRYTPIPYGPFLAAGALSFLLFRA